ncbi:MAG: hypothetical protein Q8T08_00755 [Ignavibacteria bacterium]|nr:hypothetical protein [Ignavibacteria bacterium]
MLRFLNNSKSVYLKRFTISEVDELVRYYENLGLNSHTFAPHQFDREALLQIYSKCLNQIGYIAQDVEYENIVAYSVVKKGLISYDRLRIESDGIFINPDTDYSFAPSVAINWQKQGLSTIILDFILAELIPLGLKRLFLWGGVQLTNTNAITFYQSKGFKTIRVFEHNGQNADMILEV